MNDNCLCVIRRTYFWLLLRYEIYSVVCYLSEEPQRCVSIFISVNKQYRLNNYIHESDAFIFLEEACMHSDQLFSVVIKKRHYKFECDTLGLSTCQLEQSTVWIDGFRRPPTHNVSDLWFIDLLIPPFYSHCHKGNKRHSKWRHKEFEIVKNKNIQQVYIADGLHAGTIKQKQKKFNKYFFIFIWSILCRE